MQQRRQYRYGKRLQQISILKINKKPKINLLTFVAGRRKRHGNGARRDIRQINFVLRSSRHLKTTNIEE
jgi:hypothetical protein